MRLNPAGHGLLADLVAGHLAARHGVQRKKVAAVDLDDTLWGGIVGEAGTGGIEVGGEGPGLAFLEFQRELLRLHRSGVVLVMCTKNNQDDALAGFDHPAMLLRREHFAAERINWQDKAANLRELADELNVGIDSFVFLDDNPREREWVRQALPEVVVPELPADPAERPAFLAAGPWFQTLAVTEEDRRRTESYRAQGERRRAASGARSFEDYLASLEQRVTVQPATEATIARAAQLIGKTNQFNLTTRRHAPGDVERMAADDATEVLTVAVADRFGDSGITGVVIVRHEGDAALVDTFLLSCRVLGRRVEDAVLSVVARHARERGAARLVGTFVPSDRNAQVATFYPDRGFAPTGEEGAWALALDDALPAAPDGVEVLEAARA
jgi:FkbH-like protein